MALGPKFTDSRRIRGEFAKILTEKLAYNSRSSIGLPAGVILSILYDLCFVFDMYIDE